jgi:hypothetical protein
MSAITLTDVADIEQLNSDGNSIAEIKRLTGRSSDIVASILRGQHRLQIQSNNDSKKALRHKARKAIVAIVGEKSGKNIRQGEGFLPTPQQITAACQAIRETWSDSERYSRYGCTLQSGQELAFPSPEDRE